ncbi:DUF3821 domain-containing protein [Methanoplanus limicola]|uniref:DUF3821 domain-containing protein n=1 Tax=Methanoplanus limicola DSM 2279 TaxID=937775 RepID=H1YY54_9EURY|nr:DUF3821 domain-containing protein [Methanoplanus limicola]EHQ36989.1 hypothetical protein Metlim_2956 [Methanoplanus limicola DSM 2279]
MNRSHIKDNYSEVKRLKNGKIILKSALLLIFALFLMTSPVMAGSYGTTIHSGDTVFIGEAGLDISNATAWWQPKPTIAWYTAGANPATDAPSSIITISDRTDFYVSPDIFTGKTGAWYFNPGTATVNVSFYVEEASLSVSLFNANTKKDISNLKAVTDDNIAIRIDSNLEALFSRRGGGYSGINVLVETPEGATLNALYNGSWTNSITSIQPANTLFWIPNGNMETIWKLDPDMYKTGTYKVYAQCNVNGMKDNLGVVTGVTQSEITTLTVEEDYVAITATKEPVIKEDDFTVTIAGAPKTLYTVWLSGTNGYSNTTDCPPKFLQNQDDVYSLNQATVDTTYYMNGTTVGQDIPYAADGTINEWAVVAKTGSDGTITVGLTTDSNTKTGKYTVRAEKWLSYTELDYDIYDTVDIKVTEEGEGPTISLNPGWNFISTPKRLENGNNTAGKIFGDIDSGGHSALMYNASSKKWDTVKADTEVKPLEGIWIYNNDANSAEVSMKYDSNPLQTPPSEDLQSGWNAVGFSSLTPATAKDTLVDVSGKWTKAIGWDSEEQMYETAIISGGSGIYSDTRDMNPAKAYWVWMKEEGTIAALS